MRVKCLDCQRHSDIKTKEDPKSFFEVAINIGNIAVVGYFIFTALALVIMVAFILVMDSVTSSSSSGSSDGGSRGCKHCGSGKIKKIDIKANTGE